MAELTGFVSDGTAGERVAAIIFLFIFWWATDGLWGAMKL